MDDNELIQRLKREDAEARQVAFERYSPKIDGYVRKLARIRAGRNPVTGRWEFDDSDVQDILGETFAQFFEDVPEFKGKSTLETYLHSIARNRTIDFYRAHARNNPLPTTALHDSSDSDNPEPPPTTESRGPDDETDFKERDLDPEDILRAPHGCDKDKMKAEQRLRREAYAVHAVTKRWQPRHADEARMEVYDALRRLTACQREVVTLRLLQGLTTRQTADILEKDEGAVKMALLRGIQALGEIMRHDKKGEMTGVILHD